MKHPFQTPTALAERVPMPCPNPYELLAPVRVLRKDLGLTTNDLAVLTALISYLPRERQGTARSNVIELTVVFPSNASLSERANGIDERTLRRSLGRLAAAQLIERKNSANGKRFPLRYGGVVRDAFGIDLKPLIQSFDALAARASKLAEEHERLRSLKAEALALRASLLQDERVDEAQLSTLTMIRNILRRATLTAEAVLRIIGRLRDLGAHKQASHGERLGSAECLESTQPQALDEQPNNHSSNELPVRNGQNVRHIESNNKEFKKTPTLSTPPSDIRQTSAPTMNKDPAKMAWEDFTHVTSFFPKAPQTGEALTRILYDVGKLLRIRQENLMRGLQKAGAGKMLVVLDYLLGKADTIRQPEAYFETVLRA
ncbi:helix-turn-helix domain-containing protein [Pseudotabrizicola sp. 4114]|uniref:helix-turn-helix domain-containing protein n=1 Tax=Pseudotabrizicola sp. 4114 TaxID=2817731 RepID=UPI0028574E58|nr:replication initiation protein RepC [Pseudorhodobacter sp. 4114]